MLAGGLYYYYYILSVSSFLSSPRIYEGYKTFVRTLLCVRITGQTAKVAIMLIEFVPAGFCYPETEAWKMRMVS